MTLASESCSASESQPRSTNGRLIRARAIELPALPATAAAPNLQGGSQAAELFDLDNGERVLGLTSLRPDSLGLAIGTRRGIVKRVNPEILISKDNWPVISLADGEYPT